MAALPGQCPVLRGHTAPQGPSPKPILTLALTLTLLLTLLNLALTLKDATFYYRLFESFSRLGDLGKGLLVSLAKSHSHLVDPHLYTFLEEHHLEELYRAFEQAGRFEEAALRLKFLAEETIEMREERYDKLKTVGILEGTKPPELLQQRIRWLSQAILCLQGTGIQGGSIRSLADLMQNLHDSREVLEVQQHLADEIMPIAEVQPCSLTLEP